MQIDTPMHLYNSPGNKFVAGFIGSPTMNFLKGYLRHKENYFFIDEPGECKISLGSEISGELEKYLDKKILIGIRPEDIFISEETGITHDCKVKVVAYENMGNEQLVYLSLADNSLITRRPPANTVDIGNEVGIIFSKAKIIFMQEENGEVI
jgi:multiple sugar transport system ATP-binding protein